MKVAKFKLVNKFIDDNLLDRFLLVPVDRIVSISHSTHNGKVWLKYEESGNSRSVLIRGEIDDFIGEDNEFKAQA